MLAPIAGGRLRNDAAAAWNAMNVLARKRYGVTLLPTGPNSSYRSYAVQVYFFRTMRRGMAAPPGSSNHGLGIAVDVRTRQMRAIIDRIGAPYGWAKWWSDAPWEWWHLRWRAGVWHKPKPSKYRTIRYGSNGSTVTRLQKLLRAKNVKGAPRPYGYFGQSTRRAVVRFQRKHNLRADGVVGPTTWRHLRR